MALRSQVVDESVLTKPDSRPDTQSRSVDDRVRTVDSGARADSRPRTAWSYCQHLAYVVVLAGVAAGLAWIGRGTQHVRSGMLILAASLLVAAVARLVLPERGAGLLVSRHRVYDVLVMAVFGTCILAVAFVLPVHP
jgi:Protein of unknown function (DUF3017)